MKTIYKTVILTVCIITSISAKDKILESAQLKEITKSVKVLNKDNLEVTRGIEKEEIYLLKVKAVSKRGSRTYDTFIDKKSGNVYFGSAYDKEGQQIMFPKDPNVIKEGVVFSYGEGKKELYLVTDPECPYCAKFEKMSEGKLLDYKVHVLFYPLRFHKKAPVMIEWILQGKNAEERKNRLRKITLEGSKAYLSIQKNAAKPFRYSPEAAKEIEKSLKAVKELGARSTPSLYDDTFNKLEWMNFLQHKSSKQ
jgi:thiol:disulfide interchange protein DsbC